MKQNEFNSLCKELNAHVDDSSWNNSKTLKCELTQFEAIHSAESGRNGVGELVELQTRLLDLTGIHIDKSSRSECLNIYMVTRCRSGHGFGSDRSSFLRIRDKKGKYHSLELSAEWNEKDIKVWQLARVVGDTCGATYDLLGYQDFIKKQNDNVVSLVGDEKPFQGSAWLARQYTEEYLRSMVRYLNMNGTESLEKMLAYFGCKLVKFFTFNMKLFVNPKFVRVTSKGIEIGWHTNETYCSVPASLKVTKVSNIKTVKLSDLGIEKPGYYAHSDKLRVRPEQVRVAKQFNAQFKRKAKAA